jgi:hypothetical protein
MTRGAIFRRPGKLAIHVTLATSHIDVGPRKRECRHSAVVERGAGPLRRGVTCFARRWESSGNVVWIRGLVEIALVTADACRRKTLIHTARMTLLTGDRGMGAGQRECRHGGVIESRPGPCCRGVASLAGCRKTRGDVIRILRVVEVRLVTADAIC